MHYALANYAESPYDYTDADAAGSVLAMAAAAQLAWHAHAQLAAGGAAPAANGQHSPYGGMDDRLRLVMEEPPYSRLFVRCSRALSEDQLMTLFSGYGQVEELKLICDRHTGASKGTAFVKFSKASEAARAKEDLNGKSIAASMMYIQLAEPRNLAGEAVPGPIDEMDHPPHSRLFVTCPKDMTDEDLHKIFSAFGEIQHISILTERRSGESRGIAFVKFTKASSAALAVEQMATEDPAALVKCRLADPRNQHKAQGPGAPGGSPTPGQTPTISSTPAVPTTANGNGVGGVPKPPKQHHQHQHQSWPTPSLTPPAMGLPAFAYPGASAARLPPQVTAPDILTGGSFPEYPMIPTDFNARRRDTQPRAEQKRLNNNLPPGSRLFISFSKPLPQEMLIHIFSRVCGDEHGTLENVYLLNGKNYGYAKYTTTQGAQAAIASLNNRLVEGAACRVVVADPQLPPSAKPEQVFGAASEDPFAQEFAARYQQMQIHAQAAQAAHAHAVHVAQAQQQSSPAQVVRELGLAGTRNLLVQIPPRPNVDGGDLSSPDSEAGTPPIIDM